MKMTAAKIGKIKIAVTAVILSLVVIAAVIIACESFGVFPGDYCNRIAVNSYMKKAHKGVDYTIVSQSFEEDDSKNYGTTPKNKYYVYECRLDNTEHKGETFEIAAYGFKVVSDGYYEEFLRNKELEEKVNTAVNEKVKLEYVKAYPDSDIRIFDVDCNTILPYSKYGEEKDDSTAEKVVNSLDNNFEITIYMSGDKISFGAYKKIAAQIVDVIHDRLQYKPTFTQLLYYRNFEQGEVPDKKDVVKDNKILSYESSIDYYQLSFNIEGASGMHYYVEVSDSEYKKLKAYTIFQYVYIIFVTLVIIALLTLWTVRKFKKWSKAGKTNSDRNDINAVL